MAETDPRRGEPLKTVLVRIAQLAATVIVIWFVATRVGLTFDEVAALDLSNWALSWALIAISSIVLLAGYVLSGQLWGRIVRGLGGPTLPGAVCVRLFMIANLGRYVPGKLWQIAGLAALARKRGVPATTATAAAVLGQGISLIAATAVGLGAVWSYADGASWRWIVPAVVVGAPMVGLMPPVFQAIAGLWFRLARTPRPDRLSPSDAVGWLAVGVASWLVYASSFWLLVVGLGHDVGLVATASAFAAAYVLGYLVVFAPAGIGVREVFLVAFLSPQLDAGTAAAIAAIARLWMTVVEVLPAAAFWTRHLTTTDGAIDPSD